MSTIVYSAIAKVHLHVDDEDAQVKPAPLTREELTLDQLSKAIVDGIRDNLGFEATVSSIERTDD